MLGAKCGNPNCNRTYKWDWGQDQYFCETDNEYLDPYELVIPALEELESADGLEVHRCKCGMINAISINDASGQEILNRGEWEYIDWETEQFMYDARIKKPEDDDHKVYA